MTILKPVTSTVGWPSALTLEDINAGLQVMHEAWKHNPTPKTRNGWYNCVKNDRRWPKLVMWDLIYPFVEKCVDHLAYKLDAVDRDQRVHMLKPKGTYVDYAPYKCAFERKTADQDVEGFYHLYRCAALLNTQEMRKGAIKELRRLRDNIQKESQANILSSICRGNLEIKTLTAAIKSLEIACLNEMKVTPGDTILVKPYREDERSMFANVESIAKKGKEITIHLRCPSGELIKANTDFRRIED